MTTHVIVDESKADTRRGILRWARQMLVMLVFFGVVLFLSAGTWKWPAAWVFLGMNALTQLLSAFVLIPLQGNMLAERSKIREGTKGWDRFLAPAIVILGTLAVIIVAGLDTRFFWAPPMSSLLWGVGIALGFSSQMFVLWAMASNPFFSSTVRIQTDRGHTVVDNGPYRLVRHPGYAGSLVFTLVFPLILRSWYAFLPALLTIALTFIRTNLEDKTLQSELPGYQEYAGRVQYRLIPGIW